MKKFISFSGGVESSAMCVMYGGIADAVFADAGWEHKEIYDRIGLVEERVSKVHNRDFKVHRVKNKKYDNLKDYILNQKFYPSPRARYCTRMFKIEPIDEFLNQFDRVEIMIGLNSDETDRTGNHGLGENVDYTYPLIKANINREGCKTILGRVGLLPKFPPYMKRGGCVGCFYKSKKEFYAMAQLSPDEFDEVVNIEKDIQDERGKFYSIRDGIKSMEELGKLARSGMFDPKEVYKYSPQETPCGVFCNR